jgi:hypothetical protein
MDKMNDTLVWCLYWLDRIMKTIAIVSIVAGMVTLIILGLTGNLHFVNG